ncbi:unnamed protein product [Phytomonas sp. Hart1]|nr:unnamed protein product [Phytomonas sp. Hart1]|eukprot:CCW69584.1 unnamed protein product [Phytomonas sp. isolate Hart1]
MQQNQEERRVRKERERAERKAREAAAASGANGVAEGGNERRKETEEERRVRKERERAERKAREAAVVAPSNEEENNVDNNSNGKELTPTTSPTNNDFAESLSREINILMATIEEQNREASLRSPSWLRRNQYETVSPKKENIEVHEPSVEENDVNNSDIDRRVSDRRKDRKQKKLEDGEQSPFPTMDFIRGDNSSTTMQDLRRQGYSAQYGKDLERATVLRRLVDLDDTGVVLFDAAPQSEYDLYIRSFSESGKRQVWVQAPAEEDFIDCEVQVDRAYRKRKAIQVPEDLFFYSKHPIEGNDADVDKGEVEDTKDALTEVLTPSVDPNLLVNYIHRVLPVMNAVLDSQSFVQKEGAEEMLGVDKNNSGASSLASLSYACTTYSFPLTSKRSLLKIRFSYPPSHLVAVLYSKVQEVVCLSELDRYLSVIVVWSIFDNTEPERILVSDSSLSCFCFSPSRPELLYGGSDNGSICVWDLREPDHHHLYEGCYQRLVFRLPSYSSSWNTDQHCSPVRQLCVVGYNNAVGAKREGGEQVASLDTSGEVRFWSVSDRDTRSRTNVNQNEHGVHIFSTVKLSLVGSSSRVGYDNASSTSDLSSPALSSLQPPYSGSGWGASALDFTPTDASRFVVAVPKGIQHCSRYGGITVPSLYGPSSRHFNQPIAVPCCVQFNVLDSRFLEAGYEDGTVRLFLHNQKSPRLIVAVAGAGVPIIELRCSSTARWITLVLDQNSTLHVLDHAHKNREEPQFSFPLAQTDTGACLCMDTPAELTSSGKQLLALGYEKNILQVHGINIANLQAPPAERDESWL